MTDFDPYVCEFKTTHKLFYYDWGDKLNEEVIICVHGLARNARDFDYVAKELSKNFRVICLDIVGRGKSDWVDPSLYNYVTYLNDVKALIAHLKLKKTHWIGTSMGGIIGMMLSASTPDFIDKLCLNDIGPYISRDALLRIAKYVGVNPVFENFQKAEDHLRILLAQFGIRSDKNWKYITEHSIFLGEDKKFRLNYDPKISHIFKEEVKEVDLYPLWSMVNFKKCLVLRGEISDILLPETLDFMIKSKQNISSVTFDKIGHVPALMEDDQVKVVTEWFEQK